ncbi:glutamate-1-semialdehyde 2,1-aminomutase [Constrictibacter sp. MBR-5]|jgi:glutamate-1-semialdehyde 2,1-aminomutase|uniref:aspartate aminotransferase family protein n=1 Tax=Constrictibacter sp. MBR-5 TaxID=3156467 RepID=UPI0033984F24
MNAPQPNFDLTAALRDAEERYVAANPNSLEAYEHARRSMPGGNTRTVLYYSPFPLSLAGGEGCHVTDVDGHRYIDTVSEQTAALYGHSNPKIQAAVIEALKHGIVLGGPTGRESELAELLCARFEALELVRFTNSGTEANLFAVQTARGVTGRSKIMVFEGCYHGGLMSFGGYGSTMNVPFPYVMAPYNDPDRTAALIAEHAGDLACVIMEPMIGSGGCIPAQADFVKAVREATAKHGVVLIFDEVMSSRLAPGGFQSVLGVTPDMMTMGKYLGGGLSFGAFGGRRDLMERFDPSRPDAFGHAGTFNNNVLSLSAGITGLRDVLTPEASMRINADGNRLRERLKQTLAKRGVPGTVTGYGSMLMIQLADGSYDRPKDTTRVRPEARALCQFEMLSRGVYLSRRNMLNLSLPMDAAAFDAIVAAFDGFLETHAKVLTAA